MVRARPATDPNEARTGPGDVGGKIGDHNIRAEQAANQRKRCGMADEFAEQRIHFQQIEHTDIGRIGIKNWHEAAPARARIGPHPAHRAHGTSPALKGLTRPCLALRLIPFTLSRSVRLKEASRSVGDLSTAEAIFWPNVCPNPANFSAYRKMLILS